jgi:hypothetical protein
MLKDILQWSIRMVVMIHLLMLIANQIPFLVGIWGLGMQLIYYQYLEKFPNINFKTFLFAATIGKFSFDFIFINGSSLDLTNDSAIPQLEYFSTNGFGLQP